MTFSTWLKLRLPEALEPSQASEFSYGAQLESELGRLPRHSALVSRRRRSGLSATSPSTWSWTKTAYDTSSP